MIYFSVATVTSLLDPKSDSSHQTPSEPIVTILCLWSINHQHEVDKQRMGLWVLAVLTVSMYSSVTKSSKYWCSAKLYVFFFNLSNSGDICCVSVACFQVLWAELCAAKLFPLRTFFVINLSVGIPYCEWIIIFELRISRLSTVPACGRHYGDLLTDNVFGWI